MNIDSIFISKQAELTKFKSEKEYQQTINKIFEFEEKFKNINLFKQEIYEQPPKYYLQNKIKKETGHVQDSLREQIAKLNSIYGENLYLLDIGKDILQKEENKHIYNIFKFSIIEFKKINLYEDIILESDIFFSHIKPSTFTNLTDELKLMLYDLIDDTLNYSEIYTDILKRDDVDIRYHNSYFKFLKQTILEFYVDVFTRTNPKIKELVDLFCILDNTLSCAIKIPMKQILSTHNTAQNTDVISKILSIIAELEWNLEMEILNEDVLKKEIIRLG